ncbi:MAG: nuclear transport factor 2 family protein [Gammaproteobacteria bacterium]|nr:nuclear transport factor 2 family protein [Gammaproteobacteria bacterium]
MRAQLELQAGRIQRLEHALGILQDKEEIRCLQYCYGYFMDNRMFREMTDLFADRGAWMEIGGRGRYEGKARIHAFLLDVLGEGRWGLLKDEVINHVQQQLLISVDADRLHARARGRAQIHGNSPPTTPTFLFADGIYENTYVREDGHWKIQGLTVTMTYYASLQRERISFPTAPPNPRLPPDRPSQPVVDALGRQFNPWHFRHPIGGYTLAVPAAAAGGSAREPPARPR